jgi:hypothetical protein
VSAKSEECVLKGTFCICKSIPIPEFFYLPFTKLYLKSDNCLKAITKTSTHMEHNYG